MDLSFFWSIIALLQVAFLPGFILLRCFKVQLPFIRQGLLILSLSLLFNYVFVFAATSLGFYHTAVLRCFTGVELLLTFYLLASKPKRSSWAWQTQQWLAFWQDKQPADGLTQTVPKTILICLAIVATGGLVYYGLHQWGTVFTGHDPVMSYNPWAVQWAHNQFPTYTWHYPQLIPINWSLVYVMTATPVPLEYFPKAFMTLFPVLICLIPIALAIEHKRPAYLLGTIIFSPFLIYTDHKFLDQGYVDLSAAYQGLLFIAMLLIPKADIGNTSRRWIVLMALVVAASALHKQAGLYLLILFPIFTLWIGQSGHWKTVLASWIAAILLALTWYAFEQWRINYGGAPSEVSYVTHRIYQLMGIGLARWLLPLVALTLPGCLVILLACRQGLRKFNEWGKLFWLLALPFGLIWLFYYSYSIRNFSLVMPIFSILAGLEIGHGLQAKGWISNNWQKLKSNLYTTSSVQWLVLVIIISGVLSLLPFLKYPALLHSQQTQQKQLNNPELTWQLYQYQKKHGFEGKIITGWSFLGHLPELKQFYQPWRTGDDPEGIPLQSNTMLRPDKLKPTLLKYPAKYILYWDLGFSFSSKFHHHLQGLVNAHKLKLIFAIKNFQLYEIKVPINQL